MNARQNEPNIINGSFMDGKSARVWHVTVPGVMIIPDRLSADPAKEPERRNTDMSNTTALQEKYYNALYGEEYDSAFKETEQELNRVCWKLLAELKANGKLKSASFSNTGVMIRLNPKETLMVEYTNHLAGTFTGSIVKWSIRNGILIETHSMEFNLMAANVNPSPMQSININSLYRILKSLG
jgi:hypothetical protein